MKKKPINKVVVQGYLKENNLELKTIDGGKVITGTITLATDAHQSFRVQFYKQPTKKDGSEDKVYTALSTLLPNNTVSIKKLLEGASGASFDTIKEQATKLYVFGGLDEYAYLNDNGQECKMVTIKGSSVGVCNPDKFTPKAEFELDTYIKAIRPEIKTIDGEAAETGRLVLSCYAIPYVGAAMIELDMVTDDKTYVDAENTVTVSGYINDHWNAGQSVNMRGNLVNLLVVKNEPKASSGFGKGSIANTSETEFVEERLVLGGDMDSVDANEDGQSELGFTNEDIKAGLAKRQEKIVTNTNKRKNNPGTATKTGFGPATGTTTAAPEAKKDFGLGASFGPATGEFQPDNF